MADSDAPVKHTSDAPQFGRSQIRTWLPALGQRLRQLPNAGVVLAEPAARRDRPGPALADDLVRDGDVVDGCVRHGATLTSTSDAGQRNARHRRRLALDASRTISSPGSRRPRYKDRVPRVEEVEGDPHLGVRRPRRSARPPRPRVIGRDGKKESADIGAQPVDDRRHPRRRVRPEGAARGPRRVRHRRAGHLPEHHRSRRPGPRHGARTRTLCRLVIELYNDRWPRSRPTPATGSCRCR